MVITLQVSYVNFKRMRPFWKSVKIDTLKLLAWTILPQAVMFWRFQTLKIVLTRKLLGLLENSFQDPEWEPHRTGSAAWFNLRGSYKCSFSTRFVKKNFFRIVSSSKSLYFS